MTKHMPVYKMRKQIKINATQVQDICGSIMLAAAN